MALKYFIMQVADRLSKEPKISAVYSSDLKRALETAQTIASRCGELEVSTKNLIFNLHMPIAYNMKIQGF
jgi:probable phosphoglycerate mutase